MTPPDDDDAPPHYKATARRPKKGGRYAFFVRGLQLYGEYFTSDPWAPLAPFHEAMTPRQQLRTIRDNASRLAFQGGFEQHQVDRLVSAGMPRDCLARPFTRLTGELVSDLARRKLDLLQQYLAGSASGSGLVRAPPHVRVRALAHLFAQVKTVAGQALWLNEGAEGGEGNLTRHHLDRGRKEYPRYFRGLQPLEVALTILRCDVHELRTLSRIHDAAVQSPRYRGLRGAELADAIHAKRDLALLLEDWMETTPSAVFHPRAAA